MTGALLIQIAVILVVIGLLLWAVNRFIPMDERIRQILNVVVLVGVVLWLATIVLGLAGIKVF